MTDRSTVRTLCLVTRDDHILLGLKKRGFGQGYWNGFGGKLEPGETLAQAARRELLEEAGIILEQSVPCGRLSFTFATGIAPIEVYVFRVTKCSGEPHETEEMQPRWFQKTDIPYTQMWADDQHWLPLFLANKSFTGIFHFVDDQTLGEFSVKEVADVSPLWHI